MKKRLICMLLTVLMVVSAFTGAGLSATAETVSYSTMTYRMAAGDYVLRICQRLGLNYYVCKDAIMKLNNITEGQWRYLPVGKLLTLPATDADAVVILTGHGSTAKPVTATTPVATVAAATSTSTAAATTTQKKTTPYGDDICWWYLVPYRLAAGETVVDACNALGVSFSQFQDTIKKVNKIKNWNNISAGTEIWIPTISMPKYGTDCIVIMRHMMKSGETAYGVMNERGLDYNAAKPLLQIINEKHPDLAKIQAGEAFFYPAAFTVPLQSEIHGALDTGTESNPKYKLNVGFETGAASVEFFVGNNRVYTAAAGETVKVVISPAAGRAVKDVIIRHSNGQADLYLKSAAFVMPKCDITVDATFTKGHKIEIVSNYLEKALTLVDGVAANSAAKGAAVLVASADPALSIDELYVSYMTYDGLKREKITNIDAGFVMPDVDVKVEVVLKPLPTYALFVEDAQNGTFTLQVDGGDVTRAARGAQVSIAPKPSTGFTVGNIQFFDPATGAADNTIGVFNNTFTMPARDVGVRVTFIGRGNNILMNPVEGGQFWATAEDVNGNWVQTREALTNAVVRLASQAEAGWEPSENASDYVVIRNTDGLRVPVTVESDGTVWFRMPAGGVTVTGKFVGENQNLSYMAYVYVNGTAVAANTFSGVSFFAKGDNAQQRAEFQDGFTGTPAAPAALAGAPVPAALGEYIALTYDGGAHIILDRYEIWDADADELDTNLTNEARLNGCFQMPNNNVVINAFFTSDKVKVAAADLKVIGSGTVGMVDKNDVSIDGVGVGEPYYISVSPSEGYFFDPAPADGKARLRVFRKDNGAELTPDPTVTPNPFETVNDDGKPTGEFVYAFANMPDCGVIVEATFDKVAYILQLSAEDEAGNALNAAGLWKLVINGKDNIVENISSTVNASLGDTVSINLTEAGVSKYTFVRSIINSVNSTNTVFTISGELARVPSRIIPVTIVLRSNAQGAWGNPFNLSAHINDSSRGSVGFTIAEASATYQRTVDPSAFVTKAYAGDTVAIVPKAVTPAQYYTDAKHIRVYTGWDAFIEPDGPVDVNGDGKAEEYTFVMPENGYSSINVDFIPVSYNLTINTDPADASKGLFRVFYEDWSTNSDVLLDNSFKNVPYGSVVRVELTEAGRKAELHIVVDTSLNSISPAVAAADRGAWSDGFWFKMPAGNTSLTVYLRDKTNADTGVPRGEPDPTPMDLPTPLTLTLPDSSTTTAAVQYYDAGGNLLNPAQALSGSTVKAQVMYTLKDGEKYDGPIEIQDKNGNTLATVEDGGSFEVPYTTDTPMQAVAKLAKKQYQITFTASNANPTDCKMDVKINGATYTVTPGTTLAGKVEHGTAVDIDASAASKRDIEEVQVNGTKDSTGTISGKTDTGIKIEPAGVDDGGAVTINVEFKVPEFTLKSTDSSVEFYDNAECTGTPITTAEENQTVYVKGTPSAPGKYVKTITVTDAEGANDLADGASFTVNSDADAVVKDEDDKVVTVKINYSNVPSGLKTEVNSGGKVSDSSITVEDVKEANKDITILLHDPAGYSFGTASGDTDKYTGVNSGWKYVATIDMSAVENGDTVNVNLELVTPNRSLPSTTSGGTTLKYYDKDGNDLGTSVPDGTQVYVKATPSSNSRYVTEVMILGTTISTPKANGTFGPFTITADVTTEGTDFDLKGDDKSITLVFNYKDGAASKVELYDGANKQASNASITVTNSGAVKISNVKLTTGSSFGTVKGTNVTVSFDSTRKEATFALDFAKLANGDSVTIEVNVD